MMTMCWILLLEEWRWTAASIPCAFCWPSGSVDIPPPLQAESSNMAAIGQSVGLPGKRRMSQSPLLRIRNAVVRSLMHEEVLAVHRGNDVELARRLVEVESVVGWSCTLIARRQ